MIIASASGIVLYRKVLLKTVDSMISGLIIALQKRSTELLGLPVSYVELENCKNLFRPISPGSYCETTESVAMFLTTWNLLYMFKSRFYCGFRSHSETKRIDHLPSFS